MNWTVFSKIMTVYRLCEYFRSFLYLTTVILVIITWENNRWRSLDVRRAKLPCGRIPDHRRQKSKSNNHRWTFHLASVAMCPDQPQQSAPLASPAHKELPSPPSFSVLRCSASAGLLDRATIIIMYPSGVSILATIYIL